MPGSYRPTCWPLPMVVPGSATQAASTAAVNGSNRIVLSYQRSADINALTCLDDPIDLPATSSHRGITGLVHIVINC